MKKASIHVYLLRRFYDMAWLNSGGVTFKKREAMNLKAGIGSFPDDAERIRAASGSNNPINLN